MPAQEINCTECPDDNGSGEVLATGDNFEVRIGNKILKFENGVLTLSDVQAPVPDGVYNTVTIVNGQIIDASDQVPIYVSKDCCDIGGSTGGGNGTIALVPSSSNLLKLQNGAYIVQPVFSNSGNVTVTGTGTTSNPYVLNFSGSSSGSVTLTEGSCIDVSPSTNGYEIAHEDSPVGSQTFMGISFDACGHPTSFDAGVDTNVEGTFTVGGYDITINDEGRITAIGGAGTGGTITPGSFIASDREISYNEYGIIISNVDASPPGGGA